MAALPLSCRPRPVPPHERPSRWGTADTDDGAGAPLFPKPQSTAGRCGRASPRRAGRLPVVRALRPDAIGFLSSAQLIAAHPDPGPTRSKGWTPRPFPRRAKGMPRIFETLYPCHSAQAAGSHAVRIPGPQNSHAYSAGAAVTGNPQGSDVFSAQARGKVCPGQLMVQLYSPSLKVFASTRQIGPQSHSGSLFQATHISLPRISHRPVSRP